MTDRPQMLRLAVLSLACLSGLLLAGCGKTGASPDGGGAVASKPAARFHCPMHPTYVSDRQGDCPICGMRLVPIKHGETAGDDDGARGQEEGQRVPGRVAIRIAPAKRQLIGLSTTTVERRSLARTLRTTGAVTHDERQLARIAPRFAGWVRQLEVNYTGQPVERGQRLFTVYSPEVLTAENEYLLALRNWRLVSNNLPAERESGKALLASARRRLELLQVGDEEVRDLEERGEPSEDLPFRAPFAGHVVTKNAVAGKSFMAGEALYEIADLSHLWVLASVFEYDLPLISLAQKAKVVFPYLANQEFESTITFIAPHIDPQTRRGEIRLELDNPRHELRPAMWANVEIEVNLGEALTIPASAVIDTGVRSIAFVERSDALLEPRELKVKAKTDDYVQVLEGLREGEKVVTRALFLVDSESQLKAAIAAMAGAAEHGH